MTNLEDRILKRNIPGKYTSWDDDNDNDSDGDDEYLNSGKHCSSDTPKVAGKTPSLSRNTGVKGVLFDYREAQSACEPPTSSSTSAKEGIAKSNKDEDISDDDEDQRFLEAYRKRRLLELQHNNSNSKSVNTNVSTKMEWPVFGEILELRNALQFAETIDESDKRVHCIYHLYESNIASCNILNNYLEHMARKMDFCRIFRLRASLVKPNLDQIGFPSVLVYRGGNLEANLTPITEHLPKLTSTGSGGRRNYCPFTQEDVERLMESLGVVKPDNSLSEK